MPAGRLVRIEHRAGGLRDGGRVTLSIGRGPVRFRWEARHYGYVRGKQFCDEQVRGPFRTWRHTHRVQAIGTSECLYEDRVEYQACAVACWHTRSSTVPLRLILARVFAQRHRTVQARVSRRPVALAGSREPGPALPDAQTGPRYRVPHGAGAGSRGGSARDVVARIAAGSHRRERRSAALCWRLVRSGAVSEPVSAPMPGRRTRHLHRPAGRAPRRPQPVPNRGRRDRRQRDCPSRGHPNVGQTEGALRAGSALVPPVRLGRLLDPWSCRGLLLVGRRLAGSELPVDPVSHARAAVTAPRGSSGHRSR